MTETLAPPGSCLGHRTIALFGDLDLATAPRLRQDLVDATSNGPTLVVLDLEQVEFLDSVGISVIIGGYKRLEHGGSRLHLAAPRSIVRRVLGLTRVDSMIPTYETVDEAERDCPSAHVA